MFFLIFVKPEPRRSEAVCTWPLRPWSFSFSMSSLVSFWDFPSSMIFLLSVPATFESAEPWMQMKEMKMSSNSQQYILSLFPTWGAFGGLGVLRLQTPSSPDLERVSVQTSHRVIQENPLLLKNHFSEGNRKQFGAEQHPIRSALPFISSGLFLLIKQETKHKLANIFTFFMCDLLFWKYLHRFIDVSSL